MTIGGLSSYDALTRSIWGTLLVFILAGISVLIDCFHSRPVLFFYSCAALSVSVAFIGGIVAGVV